MKYLLIFFAATTVLTIIEIFYPIRRDFIRLRPDRKSFIGATIYWVIALGLCIIFNPVFFYMCLFNKKRCDKLRKETVEELVKFNP